MSPCCRSSGLCAPPRSHCPIYRSRCRSVWSQSSRPLRHRNPVAGDRHAPIPTSYAVGLLPPSGKLRNWSARVALRIASRPAQFATQRRSSRPDWPCSKSPGIALVRRSRPPSKPRPPSSSLRFPRQRWSSQRSAPARSLRRHRQSGMPPYQLLRLRARIPVWIGLLTCGKTSTNTRRGRRRRGGIWPTPVFCVSRLDCPCRSRSPC